jgi:hypothetical protein
LPELLRATVAAVSVRIAPRNPCKFRSEFPFALGLTFVGNIASTPKSKELIMKLGKLSMLSAAALLPGGMSLALAQSNPAPSGSVDGSS